MAMSGGLVLLYAPERQGWEEKLQRSLAVNGVALRRIEAAETGETVGALAKVKGFQRQNAPAEEGPGEPVLVLYGLTGGRLDGALRVFGKAGVPRSVYKAVVTADNAKWTFSALYEELRRERAAIEEGGAAHS